MNFSSPPRLPILPPTPPNSSEQVYKSRSTEEIKTWIAARWAGSSAEPLINIMGYSPQRAQGLSSAPSPSTTTPTTTSEAASLSEALQNLDLGAASRTLLPDSPQVDSSSHLSTATRETQQRSPLRRSGSSDVSRSLSTPTLLRKASMNSLHSAGGRTPKRDSLTRRTSSSFTNRSPSVMSGRGALSDMEEDYKEKPRHTAASIAQNHFKSELERLQNGDMEGKSVDTIVVLHDSCYGHRYSRPRTSKASLSTIVERPERIHASILGVSAAYVRLGGRHSEGLHPLHPELNLSSIQDTPFHIRKTTRLMDLSSQAVTNVHGAKWMEELKIMCKNAEVKLATTGKELIRPDAPRATGEEVPPKLHEGDLYLCSESLDAMQGALGAVCEGVDAVFEGSSNGKGPTKAFVAIRPPGHHCSASYPSGFCWVNNVHVGIAHAALAHGLTHAAIIDFDLHHGDGSQAIAWDQNTRAQALPKNALQWKKTSIGYFSLHDINSYPCESGDEDKVKNASLCIENAHGQSVWNVHLQPWKSEADFWELYETKYSILLEKTRSYLRAQNERPRTSSYKPKGAIFLSAGFDASEWEGAGMQRHKVNVPTEFYARLSRDVAKLAAEEGTGVNGRVISVLEGGYSDRALASGVMSHLSGLAGGDAGPLTKENHLRQMTQQMGASTGMENPFIEISAACQPYDPLWWSLPRLEQLEAVINSAPPPPEPEKPKDGPMPAYYSPTQSFMAKVSPRGQRSVSGMSNGSSGAKRDITPRASTPPPPEVHWTVATHELSKLLIPSDRQTRSCKVEDLAAEATRQRRDRQSVSLPVVNPDASGVPSNRMALRTRKPAKPVTDMADEEDTKRTKKSRRTTVAGPAVLTVEKNTSRSTTPTPVPGLIVATQPGPRNSVVLNAGSAASQAPVVRPAGLNRKMLSSAANVTSRPTTSQSTGPESTANPRGPVLPPAVAKKPRASANPQSEVKAPRIRRSSPSESQSRPSKSPAKVATTVQPVPALPATSNQSDIDSLTTGMKKVKITLVTPAQREAKAKAKLAEAQKSASSLGIFSRDGVDSTTDIQKTVVEPTGNETSSQVVAQDFSDLATATPPHTPDTLQASESLKVEDQFSETIEPILQQTQLPEPNGLLKADSVLLPMGSPPGSAFSPVSEPVQTAVQTGINSDVFIPFQPEGPLPDSVLQQAPLQWLPPNSGTPAAQRKKELPVFTNTSAIPFGTPAFEQKANDIEQNPPQNE